MSTDHRSNARIVLFGLEESLAAELGSVLAKQQQAVYAEPFVSGPACLGLIEKLKADLAFCPAERERYMPLLEAVIRRRPDFPVVVVSRAPEVTAWLDAMEAGASDYCASPFESSHIRWIVDSNLKRHTNVLRYRTAAH